MSSGPVPPAYQDLPAVHGDIVFRESDHTYWQGDPDGGERLLSATQVGKLAGLIDTRWFKPHHADRGTKIHKALEYFDQPDVDLDEENLDEAIVPYLTAYRKFIEDHQPRWEGVEEVMADTSLMLAGTIDRWGTMVVEGSVNRVMAVVDIKTGGSAPFHALQLACYQHLIIRHLQLTGKTTLTSSQYPVRRYALYLRKRGTYKLAPFTDVKDVAVFMAAHTVASWKVAQKVGLT